MEFKAVEVFSLFCCFHSLKTRMQESLWNSQTPALPFLNPPMLRGFRVSRYCDVCRMVLCSCYLAQNTHILPQDPRSPAPHKQPFRWLQMRFIHLQLIILFQAAESTAAHRAPSTSPRGGGGSNRDVSPPACPGQIGRASCRERV